MVDYSPTIIAASLNDKELQESIKSLVSTVKTQTETMAGYMNTAVANMKASLKSLGNISVDMGGAADGGSSRRTKKQVEEKQAVDGTTVSYQNLEAAKQKAIGSSPAQDSYQEFVKNMRQNVALLAMEIKDMPNWSLDKQFGNYMQYERQIEQTRQRIQELKQELQNVGSDPNGSRLVIKQITEQIAQEQQKLVQLQKEQITTTKQIELADKQALAQKQAQYETEKKALVDMSVGKREIVTFGERQASQEAKITEEIRKQIEAISNRKDATKAFEQISLMPQGSMEEISAKGRMLQQLLEKVRDTPFMSQTNIKLAERQLNSLVAQFRALKQEKERVADTQTTNASAEQKTEQALERERQNLEQVRQAQEARKQAIIDTGVAASQQTERMLASIAEQQKSLDYTKQIEGVKELQVALRQMQNAYNTMDASDPMRDTLRQRIETTKEAIAVAQRYNMVVAGIGGFGGSAPKDTIAAYSLEIQRLANIYETLSVEERDAAAGKGLVNKYQELTKTVSDWQKQLTRPTSLSEAMKGDAKTIDDITYKIQRLQLYKSGIDFTDPKQASEITQVDNKIQELEKDLQKYMGTTRQAQNANNALTRSWNYMKNRLAFYFTVGASTAFVKNLIEVRSQYEMNERALGILINSAERGTQIFKELSEMALVSPYTLIELSSATKQLVAYGVAAKDAVDTTRRLADMAAAVGIPMERLTYALGQIKAYGYLNSRDQRMFANAGIPLVQELAKYYTELEGRLVTSADVYDRIKKKMVEYGDVVQVINKMTDEGGKFFDYQSKMAETLKVQLANLTLAWNNMLNEIGTEWQGVLSYGISGLKQLFLAWKDIEKIIYRTIWAFGLFKAAQIVITSFREDVSLMVAAVDKLPKRFAKFGDSIGNAFKSIAANWQTIVAMFAAYAVVDLFATIYRNAENIRKLNISIAENSEEAAKSIDKLLRSETMLEAKLQAGSKKLSQAEAEKTWGVIREEIENSSIAAGQLIPKLLDIGDANERLTKAFEMAEDLRDVQYMLSGLQNELKIDQDTAIFGAFGEGLAEDLQDYQEYLEFVDETTEFSAKKQRGFWESLGITIRSLSSGISETFGNSFEEAKEEAEEFAKNAAKTIEDLLGKDGVKNATKLAEAIARVKKEVFAANPQIRGRAKSLLESTIDDVFGKRFEAYDNAAAATQMFLDQLQKDYGSAFSNITTDILDKNNKWNKEQKDAFKATYEKLEKDIPDSWAKILDDMLTDMNSRDWTIRVMAKFDVTTLSDVQKAFNERFIDPKGENGVLSEEEAQKQRTENERKYGKLRRKDGEDNVEYEKRISEEKQKQKNIQERNLEIYNKQKDKTSAIAKDAKKAADEAAEFLKAADEVEKWGDYDFTTKGDIKAQKQAESELAKALKEELSLIDKVRSNYKKLTKDGVDATTALSTATSGFDETVSRINAVLGKYGIGQIDLTKYAGVSNPKAIMEMLQAQLDALSRSGLAKTSEIKDLQVKLQDLNVESLTFDQQTLTQSLNSELSKLKDEYELAVELDANPELGGVFADMMGLSKEELEKLPRDFEGVVRKLQTIVDNKLGMGAFDVRSNLNKDVFDQWVKSNEYAQDSDLVAKLKAITDYANKVRQDETKKQIEDWNKLLEKYAEYEYKRTQIIQEAERERETARKKNAGDDILRAIDIREQRELAKLDFEQFQRSPEWITATGDLATLTDKALGTLIKDLEEYKKKAKNLDPKQIKQLNDALKKLRNQQRQGNPFLAIKRAFEEAAEKAEPFNQKVKELTERWMELKRKQSQSDEGVFLTKDEQKELDELPEKIDKAQKEAQTAGKLSAQAMVAAINEMLQPINMVTGAIGDMFSAFGNTEASENIKKVSSMLDKAVSFATMGAAIGGHWGAAIGGIVGLIVGGITALADEISGNADISDEIESSERAVKRLSNEYNLLQKSVEDAYGSAAIGMKKIAIENKQLQLMELERQLSLEKRRNSKNYDIDRVIELEGQILDLRMEIEDLSREVINDFLGISSAVDAVENMVDVIVDSLRNGEDAMASFDDSLKDMVANMIKQVIASKILGPMFDDIWKQIEDKINKRAESANFKDVIKRQGDVEDVWRSFLVEDDKTISQVIQDLENKISSTNSGNSFFYKYADDLSGVVYSNAKGFYDWYFDQNNEMFERMGNAGKYIEVSYDEWKKQQEEILKKYKTWLTQESTPTFEDVKDWGKELLKLLPEFSPYVDEIDKIISELGLKKEESQQSLSNLQQGIQGITEDTAGAIESYLNGISQQIYLHSDVLIEIRDVLQSFDFDVRTGVQAQILLELQTGFQTVNAMRTMMENWQTAAGNGIKVEIL